MPPGALKASALKTRFPYALSAIFEAIFWPHQDPPEPLEMLLPRLRHALWVSAPALAGSESSRGELGVAFNRAKQASELHARCFSVSPRKRARAWDTSQSGPNAGRKCNLFFCFWQPCLAARAPWLSLRWLVLLGVRGNYSQPLTRRSPGHPTPSLQASSGLGGIREAKTIRRPKGRRRVGF